MMIGSAARRTIDGLDLANHHEPLAGTPAARPYGAPARTQAARIHAGTDLIHPAGPEKLLASASTTLARDRRPDWSAALRIQALHDPVGSALHAQHAARPELDWLMNKDGGHANILVPTGGIDNARCLFQELLERDGTRTQFLDRPADKDKLELLLNLDENGAPDLAGEPFKDGPLNQVIKSGGTLVVNVANFSKQEFEAFNTLMEEKIWNGEKLEKPPRIICLFEQDAIKKRVLSGAQVSRNDSFEDMSAYDFPAFAHPEIEATRQDVDPSVQYLDLQCDVDWEQRMFGAPGTNERQQWVHVPGKIADLDFRHPLILRNPPCDPKNPARMDPRLSDLIRAWRLEGREVRVEDDVPLAQVERLSANKRAAADLGTLLSAPDAPVCTVNSSNLDEVLDDHDNIHNGFPIRSPGLLNRMQQGLPADQRMTVMVSDFMPPHMWDRLMMDPQAFDVAAAAHVNVPARYAAQVYRIRGNEKHFPHERLYQEHINVVNCYDAVLTDRDLGIPDAVRIIIDPGMRSEDLLSTLTHADPLADPSGHPNAIKPLKVVLHQLVTSLQRGENVILHGLESNPDLQLALASLLNPPHYLYINGERLAFGPQGSLRGRLIVLSENRNLAYKYQLSPHGMDRIHSSNWKEMVKIQLQRQFQHLGLKPEAIDTQLAQLLTLFELLAKKQLAPGASYDQPPVPYATLETLFRYLFVPQPPETLGTRELFDPQDEAGIEESVDVQQRQLRGLLKGMLIGDFRDKGSLYAQLKVWLRLLFPQQMTLMPARSVDTLRLQKLLNATTHKKDILENPWAFLNLFSDDIVRQLVGPDLIGSRESQRQLALDVLAVVLDQADAHQLDLPQQLKKILETEKFVSPVPGDLAEFLRPPKLTHDQRDLGIGELISRHGNAMFLKGAPGSGKTHRVATLRQGKSHPVNIANASQEALAQALEDWVNDDDPRGATLELDEANLSAPGALAVLEGIFINRTVYVRGKIHHLSEKHHLILTGNGDHFPGRSVQPVAKKWIPTLPFKGIPESVLPWLFVDPVLDEAASRLGPALDRRMQKNIRATVMAIHGMLVHGFSDLTLSPRKLRELTMQVTHLLAHPPAGLGPQGFTAENIKPWIGRLALNIYNGQMSADRKVLVASALKRKLRLKAGADFPALPSIQIADQTISATTSAQELADRISWWSRAGHQALLIKGPSARGKDKLVSAVLGQEGRKLVHLNADPHKLQELDDAIRSACENGQVLVVSELNLLPSGLLESRLNAILTGQSPILVRPGFAFVGTINPDGPDGYGARQKFSDAFLDRMEVINIDHYGAEEVPDIINKLAATEEKSASRPQAAAWLRGKAQVISQDVQEKVVATYLDYLTKLSDAPDEYRPTLRQVRATFKNMRFKPLKALQQVLDKAYGFYDYLVDHQIFAPGARALAQQAEARQEACQAHLEDAIRFMHPGWVAYPTIRPYAATDSARLDLPPVSYDAEQHAVRFNSRLELAELTDALLALLDQGLQPRPEVQALPRRQGLTVRRDATLITSTRTGAPGEPGYFGSMQNVPDQLRLMPLGRYDLEGRLRNDYPEIALPNAGLPSPEQAIGVEVPQPSVERIGENGIVNLLAPPDFRPANVMLDQTTPAQVHRNAQGAWYCVTDQKKIARLQYELTPCEVDTEPPPQAGASMPALDFSANPAFHRRVMQLKQAGLNSRETVAQLSKIFRDEFEYSHDDADALNQTADLTQMVEHFLTRGKKGVCNEFATAFAMILKQEFGIDKVELPDGYRIGHDGKISAVGHLWVRYWAEGQWHDADPTPPARTPVGQKEQRALRRAERNASGQPIRDVPGQGAGNNVVQRAQLLGDGFWESNAPVDPAFLPHFSLEQMELETWQMTFSTAKRNRSHGKLDYKRMLAGHTDIFIDSGLDIRKVPREIHIENLRKLEGQEQGLFKLTMFGPLNALIEKGVPIYTYNHRHTPTRLQSANSLQAASARPPLGEGLEPEAEEDDRRIVINEASQAFLERVRDHYYQTLLTANAVDTSDEEAVKKCLWRGWAPLLRYNHSGLTLPFDFQVGKLALRFTQQDLDRYRMLRTEDDCPSDFEKIVRLLDIGKNGVFQSAERRAPYVEKIEQLLSRDPAQFSATDRSTLLELIIPIISVKPDGDDRRRLLSKVHQLVGAGMDAQENQYSDMTNSLLKTLTSSKLEGAKILGADKQMVVDILSRFPAQAFDITESKLEKKLLQLGETQGAEFAGAIRAQVQRIAKVKPGYVSYYFQRKNYGDMGGEKYEY